MKNLRIGWAVCGSFCTIDRCCSVMVELAGENALIPIISEHVCSIDTRFGSAAAVRNRIEGICGRQAITTISAAEPLGPKESLDLLIIAPCTGNTLAKLARGITDTTVTMAAKAHLRESRPTLIALASNDALSANLISIALTIERKGIYYIPMQQDDPIKKPHSLIAQMESIPRCAEAALSSVQLQPIFLS